MAGGASVIHESYLRPVLVGNRRYPRYAIALERSRFSPTLYWSGAGDDPWTAEVCGALRWADFVAVMTAIREMETGEPDDSRGRR
jgi:hypothetical protein